MSNQLVKLHAKNYRSLENVTLEANALNILFGPNGAGKSTLLDTLWFIKDCVIRGVDEASSERNHGIGLLWDNAKPGENIQIELETENAQYEVSLGISAGRIDPFVGEKLYSKHTKADLIDRKIGSPQAIFYHYKTKENVSFPLREPENLALTRYLDFESRSPEGEEINNLLYYANFYHARSADLFRLKKLGSESTQHVHLYDRCQNLWSVLRNVHGRRSLDNRYDTIIDFMRGSFPAFKDLYLEATGPSSVYGNFIQKGRKEPIRASGVSDGHLQMLINLTALFSTGKEQPSLVLFDEPEISLHPYALAIFAKAVNLAVKDWNKQVFIATHSPVLLSQFDAKDILAVSLGERGETKIQRVSEMDAIQDLLEEYAAGSLYMAGLLAPQDTAV